VLRGTRRLYHRFIKEEVGGLLVWALLFPRARRKAPWVGPARTEAALSVRQFQLAGEMDHLSIFSDPDGPQAQDRGGIPRAGQQPAIYGKELKKRILYNGQESFNPDNQFILGEGHRMLCGELLRGRRIQLSVGHRLAGGGAGQGAGRTGSTDGDPGDGPVESRPSGRFAGIPNGNNPGGLRGDGVWFECSGCIYAPAVAKPRAGHGTGPLTQASTASYAPGPGGGARAWFEDGLGSGPNVLFRAG